MQLTGKGCEPNNFSKTFPPASVTHGPRDATVGSGFQYCRGVINGLVGRHDIFGKI